MTDAVTFTTASGSAYRVDYSASTIERLGGRRPPTARLEGGARRFEEISAIEVDRPVWVRWGEHSASPALLDLEPYTETSPVVSISAHEGAARE